MDFTFYPLRFRFQALDPIYFPPGKSANVLRGGFGLMLRRHSSPGVYQRIFEPRAVGSGPSGLRDWPRPFVMRASHLDGRRLAVGESFFFDLNLFDTREGSAQAIRGAFQALGAAGLGPAQGRAELASETEMPLPVTIQLGAAGMPEINEVRIDFVTPLELKSGGGITPTIEFQPLFARIRDRISTLRTLYGPGPLDIDFKALGKRAGEVRRTGGEWAAVRHERRSSRTGQVHEIGGLVGWASYAGDLREFLPYLRAAEWCGVGRQCTWGKGQIRLTANVNKS